MSQPNSGRNSSPSSETPTKRKRGRPRKENNVYQQGETSSTRMLGSGSDNPPAASENLVGQVVSGVIEGSFDAGYFLNVKVSGTDKLLRGVVFSPGRVLPVSLANDVAPHAKMYKREEVAVSCVNQQLQLHGIKSKTNDGDNQMAKLSDEIVFSEQNPGMVATDKNQSSPENMLFSDEYPETGVTVVLGLPARVSVPENENTGVGSGKADVLVAEDDRSAPDKIGLPNSWLAKEKGDTLVEKVPSLEISVSGTESQPLSLKSQTEKNGVPEASKEINLTVNRLVDFLQEPEPAKAVDPAEEREIGSSSNPNLKIFQIENNPPASAENLGVNIATETPVNPMEAPPTNLQLELGNKIASADNSSFSDRESKAKNTEANPRSSSMSGFLANLFEENEAANEPEHSVSQGGSLRSTEPEMNASPTAASNKDNEGIAPR